MADWLVGIRVVPSVCSSSSYFEWNGPVCLIRKSAEDKINAIGQRRSAERKIKNGGTDVRSRTLGLLTIADKQQQK